MYIQRFGDPTGPRAGHSPKPLPSIPKPRPSIPKPRLNAPKPLEPLSFQDINRAVLFVLGPETDVNRIEYVKLFKAILLLLLLLL